MLLQVLVKRVAPTIPEGLPSGLTALLQQCLDFDPAARPTANEALQVGQ